jgi:hypothetical protein
MIRKIARNRRQEEIFWRFFFKNCHEFDDVLYVFGEISLKTAIGQKSHYQTQNRYKKYRKKV